MMFAGFPMDFDGFRASDHGFHTAPKLARDDVVEVLVDEMLCLGIQGAVEAHEVASRAIWSSEWPTFRLFCLKRRFRAPFLDVLEDHTRY